MQVVAKNAGAMSKGLEGAMRIDEQRERYNLLREKNEGPCCDRSLPGRPLRVKPIRLKWESIVRMKT